MLHKVQFAHIYKEGNRVANDLAKTRHNVDRIKEPDDVRHIISSTQIIVENMRGYHGVIRWSGTSVIWAWILVDKKIAWLGSLMSGISWNTYQACLGYDHYLSCDLALRTPLELLVSR